MQSMKGRVQDDTHSEEEDARIECLAVAGKRVIEESAVDERRQHEALEGVREASYCLRSKEGRVNDIQG